MPFRIFLRTLRRVTNRCHYSTKSNLHSPFFSLYQEKFHVLRGSAASGALRSYNVTATENEEFESQSHPIKDDLKSRIFRLRLPKRSATDALEKWVAEGKQITQQELRQIVKELCKSQRYKHALEISEWMRNCQQFDLSDSDYGVYINLITKVMGVNAAEEYFEGLPNTEINGETYTSLLHSFAAAKLTDRAEKLFDKIKTLNLTVNALPYNEMMTLYISTGEFNKVPLVIEELKSQQIPPDLFTYNLWTSSCAASLDINGVRRILDEMRCDSNLTENWKTYIKLAEVYITAGQLENSVNALVEAEKKITQQEWITYDFLIILHAGLGNKDRMRMIWNSLKMTSQKMTSRNYLCIISSHLMLGQVREAGEIIDEWKHSTAGNFDICMCNRLVDAFARDGLVEKANSLRGLLLQRECKPINGLDN